MSMIILNNGVQQLQLGNGTILQCGEQITDNVAFALVSGSKSPAHIKENAEIFDFELTHDEMFLIAALNRHEPFYKVTPESLRRMATTRCNFEE